MFHTSEFEVVLWNITQIKSPCGEICPRPLRFPTKTTGSSFIVFFWRCRWLSGVADTLPVIADKSLLESAGADPGGMLTVTGQIRSHNVRTDGRRHLMIFVFASALTCEDGEALNDVVLEGFLCREPIYRRTPLGREICDVMLAVPRAFQRADYLPCILWGRTAQEASRCHTRDKIGITGRLQSRVYTKLTEEGAEERTAYEISALTAQIPMDLL